MLCIKSKISRMLNNVVGTSYQKRKRIKKAINNITRDLKVLMAILRHLIHTGYEVRFKFAKQKQNLRYAECYSIVILILVDVLLTNNTSEIKFILRKKKLRTHLVRWNNLLSYKNNFLENYIFLEHILTMFIR